MLFKTCSKCGANLDPGEVCDCCGDETKNREKEAPDVGQITFNMTEKLEDSAAGKWHGVEL